MYHKMESVLLCLSLGRGFLLNFLGPTLAAHATGPPSAGGLSVHTLWCWISHQRVEGTLLALVSRGWVSMGLARRPGSTGDREPQPSPQLDSHTQAATGLSAMGSSSGSPPGSGEVWLPDGEASGRREAACAQRDPLLDMGIWQSWYFKLS